MGCTRPSSGPITITAIALAATVIGASLLNLPAASGESPAVFRHNPFVRGDANGDGFISIADILSLIRFFHDTSFEPPCRDAADFDDSGVLDITDVVTLVKFMFFYGELPPRPYPDLGFDLTPDPLDCISGSRAIDGAGGGDPEAAGVEGGQPISCEGAQPGTEVDFIHFLSNRVVAYPGQRDLRIPIVAQTIDELEGFTLSVHADPLSVWLERFDFQDTPVSMFRPEGLIAYNHNLREGYLAEAVFMEYIPPFEGKVFPKKQCGAVIANLVFSISPEARPGDVSEIRFSSTPGLDDLRPSFVNEFSVRGSSVFPKVDPFGVTITIHPKNRLFIRGDGDRDGIVNITDVILILRYLFLSEPVDCLDVVDVDDQGEVNITDAIALVTYLFNGGAQPPAPFPYPGLDPTPDPLGNCPSF